MAKDKESVQFYYEYINQLEDLDDSQFRKVVVAMVDYDKTGTHQDLDTLSKMAFKFIQKRIDYDKDRYLSICERNKNNGSRGGRPKKEENPEEPKKPNGLFGNPKKPKKPDIDIDIDLDIDNITNRNINNINVFSHYEQNIGTLSSYLIEQLETLVKKYGDFKVQQAISRACEIGKRNMSYIKGILNQWGDKTWEEILDMDQKYNNSKNKTKEQVTPNWMGQSINKEEITEQEQKELEMLLNEYKN